MNGYDQSERWLSAIPSEYTRKTHKAGIKKLEIFYGRGIETLIEKLNEEKGRCARLKWNNFSHYRTNSISTSSVCNIQKTRILSRCLRSEFTHYSEGLASVLEKIANKNKGRINVSEAVSHIFFVNPKQTSLDSLFAIHPPIKEIISD